MRHRVVRGRPQGHTGAGEGVNRQRLSGPVRGGKDGRSGGAGRTGVSHATGIAIAADGAACMIDPLERLRSAEQHARAVPGAEAVIGIGTHTVGVIFDPDTQYSYKWDDEHLTYAKVLELIGRGGE